MQSSKNALISIIIPLFNRETFIHQCIDSVVAQTHRPIEVLVVDDGSTDKGVGIAESRISDLQLESIDLRIFSTGGRKGAPVARNIGTREAKGDFIQYLDSDDLLLPEKLSVELGVFENTSPRPDMVYSVAQVVDEHHRPLPMRYGKKLDGSAKDYSELRWQTMCALYSREALERLGPWREDLRKGQDFEYGLRTILSGLRLQFVDRVHSLHLSHGKGQMADLLGKSALSPALLHTNGICLRMLEEKQRLGPRIRARWFTRMIILLADFEKLRLPDKRDEALDLCRQYRLGSAWKRWLCRQSPLGIAAFWWAYRLENSIRYRLRLFRLLLTQKEKGLRLKPTKPQATAL